MTDSPASSREGVVFFGLAALMLMYVVLRAAYVPFVHDEATSFIAYAQPGTFLPFASMWDANNHFLNSLCGHAGYRLFGLHPLALRWASVLSYVLFAWCAWHLGERIGRPIIRWLLWLALLACPFLLDFFSLFRGYGPAMALLLLAVYQASCYLESRSERSLAVSLLAMSAAMGFMLGLLPLALVLQLALFTAAYRVRRHTVIGIALGLIPLLLIALLAKHMAALGLLYHGGTDGYASTTIGSLLKFTFGVVGEGRPQWLVLFTTFLTALLIWMQRRAGIPHHLMLVAAMLWGEWALRWLLACTIGLNYAEDRTALHVLVLFILFVAFTADALRRLHAAAWLLAIPLLALPLRVAFTANLDRTALWPEQSIPGRFMARIEALEKELDRPAIVGAHRLATMPFGLQRRLRGGEGDATAANWPNALADARIEMLGVPFDNDQRFALADSASNGLRLYVRSPMWHSTLQRDSAFAMESDGGMRSVGLPIPAQLIQASDVIVDVSGSLRATSTLDLRACVAVYDSTGAVLHVDHLMLTTRRALWNGEHWRTALAIPREPLAARAEFFLWEIGHGPFKLSQGRMRVHAMR
ncbi:MAG TPA: hypothetical protein PKY96_00330 [Flavobacteriales bacterium]|nr:hypothetical protein [Flavobacteriales bacterium]HRD51070.1 hypothetical protein [Flavobacteriales bacterium]